MKRILWFVALMTVFVITFHFVSERRAPLDGAEPARESGVEPGMPAADATEPEGAEPAVPRSGEGEEYERPRHERVLEEIRAVFRVRDLEAEYVAAEEDLGRILHSSRDEFEDSFAHFFRTLDRTYQSSLRENPFSDQWLQTCLLIRAAMARHPEPNLLFLGAGLVSRDKLGGYLLRHYSRSDLSDARFAAGREEFIARVRSEHDHGSGLPEEAEEAIRRLEGRSEADEGEISPSGLSIGAYCHLPYEFE